MPLSACGTDGVAAVSSQLNVVPEVLEDKDIGPPEPKFLLRHAVACAAEPYVFLLNDIGVSTVGVLAIEE